MQLARGGPLRAACLRHSTPYSCAPIARGFGWANPRPNVGDVLVAVASNPERQVL
jgi:hypothetical protein